MTTVTMATTVLLCILIADLITGLVHWWEDSYGLPSWPVLGKIVVEPNIDHHLRPGVIGSMTTLISRNYQTVVPALAVAWLLWRIAGVSAWPIALTFLLAAFGNEVHAWNHRGRNGPIVRLLQDAAIIQTPQQHARHHRPPFDAYYCTLTNFTNALLESVNFWRGLEWCVWRVSGITHRRCCAERMGV